MTHTKKIGVIGTEATVRSCMYEKIMQGICPEVEVLAKACPLFVPLVEEGFKKHPVTDEIIAKIANLKYRKNPTLPLRRIVA